jgi:hypothetical protein
MRRPPDPAEAIEDLPQAMFALGGIFSSEGQVWDHQGPFIITDITGVGFAFHIASVASSR